MNIADIVRQLLASGIKQDDLARELKVTQPTVSRWLAGADPRGSKREQLLTFAQERGLLPTSLPAKLKAAPSSRFIMVPVITWISAGKLTAPTSQIPAIDVPMIPVGDLKGGEWFALRVSGTSMNRISPDNSIIIVNKTERSLQDGKAYVVSIRGEATYKIWRQHPARLEPFSTDPSNDPIFIDRRNTLEVVGRVRRSFIDL
jgi:SOS-response transcriptional repressor LexA